MRMLLGYLKERTWFVLLLALWVALFAGVLYLYNLPPEAAGYGGLLCAAALLLWTAVDFVRYRRKIWLLRSMLGQASLLMDSLPEAVGPPYGGGLPRAAPGAASGAAGRRLRLRRLAAGDNGLLYPLGPPDQNAHRRYAPDAPGGRNGPGPGAGSGTVPGGAVRGTGVELPAFRRLRYGLRYSGVPPGQHPPQSRAEVCAAVYPGEGVYRPPGDGNDRTDR